MSQAEAIARTNIALVKYWGKADLPDNLPATGSLSLTLSSLHTRTRVCFESGGGEDLVLLDGRPAPEPARLRVSRLLDRVRALAGLDARAVVESSNNFPTAAGLASSASGFAALAAAACRAAELRLDDQALADLARRGSGSAPRSLLGGFVQLHAPAPPDAPACRLEQVAPREHWDLRLVLAINDPRPKAVGSTEGMERSRRSSPYFPAWIDSHPADLAAARRAVRERDLAALGQVTEASCFKMHALAMSSRPALVYFNPVSVACFQRVWQLRAEGIEGYVTIDAGPHVKVLCRPQQAPQIRAELAALDGVRQVLIEAPGPGTEVIA